MKDLCFLKALASGAIEAEAPMIHAAGVLRCLERQQGTELMLSSVISALAEGARVVGQGPFMVDYLHFAATRLAEMLPPPVATQPVTELIVEPSDAIVSPATLEINTGAPQWGKAWAQSQVVDLRDFRAKREG